MTTTATSSLNLKQVFPAPVERVWDAWTKPENVRQWYAPGAYTIPEIEMDVRRGGRYRILMHNPETDVRQTLIGTYKEVTPGKRLVYTWQWRTKEGTSPDTLVTVTFEDHGDQTAVTVVHDLFPDLDMRDKHIKGWTACLEKLRQLRNTKGEAGCR